MAERQSGSSAQVTVALIGVVGVIGAAVIGNWDKIAGTRGGDSPAPAPAPSATDGVGPAVVAPVEAAKALGESQARALQSSATALDGIAAQIDAANTVRIGGNWRDSDGFVYRIEQQGAAFTYGQFMGGALVGSGKGIVAARALDYSYQAGNGTSGRCRADVSSDGSTISGRCTSGAESWPVTVVRAGTAS